MNGNRRKKAVLFTILAFVMSLFSFPAGAAATGSGLPETLSDSQPAYAADEVIVKYKPARRGFNPLASKSRMGLQAVEKVALTGSELFKIKDGSSVEETVDRLKNDPDVVYAQPNYIYYAQQTVDDPLFHELWGLDNTGQLIADTPGTGGAPDVDIDAPEAWDITMGSSDVIVAVIDTGVDITHPDLVGSIWTNPGEIPGNDIDDDGNGQIDDVNGWDFYYGDEMVYHAPDEDEHGTHVAGTIAAAADNAAGVAGVAPNVKIMPVKFLGPGGTGSTLDAVAAIEYAAANGAKVINASWGGPGSGDDPALRDAITASGAVFVTAAGNEGLDNDVEYMSPANLYCSNIIVAAAVDNQGSLAAFSNYGAQNVDVGAPGVNILSLKPGADYKYLSGTSMAAPHVSGIAALMLSVNPNLSASQVIEVIKQTVKPAADLEGVTAAGGIADAYNAVREVVVNPVLAVSGRTAAKDGAVLQFGGTTPVGASVYSAKLEQLDASGEPIPTVDFNVYFPTNYINITDGLISGSFTVPSFDAAAESVRLSLTVDMGGTLLSEVISLLGISDSFPVDNTSPTPVLTYNRTSPMKSGALQITATFSENLAEAPTINIDQLGAIDIAGVSLTATADPKAWGYNYTVMANGSGYADGTATVSVSAIDGAGNVNSPAANNTFIIDTIPPSTPAISQVDNKNTPAISSNPSPQVVVDNVSAGDIVKIYNGISEAASGPAGGPSLTVTLNGLSDGTHSLTSKAVDSAGNISGVSNNFSYTVDTSPPEITPITASTNVPVNSVISFRFSEDVVYDSVYEAISNNRIVLKKGYQTISAVVYYDENTEIVTITPAANLLYSTTYIVKASAVNDVLGNAIPVLTPKTWSFTTEADPNITPGGGGGGGVVVAAVPETNIEKTIPTSGGTVSSADKAITVIVPSGALDPGVSLKLTAKEIPENNIKAPIPPEMKIGSAIIEFGPNGKTFNKPVKITLQYNPSLIAADNAAPYYLNESTNRWDLIENAVVDKSVCTVTFETTHFSKYTIMGQPAPEQKVVTFSDLTSHWAKADIEYLAGRGIVGGKAGNLFDPDGKVTRAEFARMLVGALNLSPVSSRKTFADVEENAWYCQWVETAFKAGIAAGSNGRFRPNDKVTRQEMAVMIISALSVKNKILDSGESAMVAFTDSDKVSAWATSSVAAAVNAKILNGKSTVIIAPLDDATRAEASVMIKKMIEQI